MGYGVWTTAGPTVSGSPRTCGIACGIACGICGIAGIGIITTLGATFEPIACCVPFPIMCGCIASGMADTPCGIAEGIIMTITGTCAKGPPGELAPGARAAATTCGAGGGGGGAESFFD